MTSLHERLGGLDAIKTVEDSFVARAAADDRVNKKFARTDVPRLKKENIWWLRARADWCDLRGFSVS